MNSLTTWFAIVVLTVAADKIFAQPSKHSPVSQYPTYEGRVMCGYQGWFRAGGDGSGGGWSHYSGRGALTAATLHPDFWADVLGYEKTYPNSLTDKGINIVHAFRSVERITSDLHCQ